MKLQIPQDFTDRYIKGYLKKKVDLGDQDFRTSAVCIQATNNLMTIEIENQRNLTRKLEIGGQGKWEEKNKKLETCTIEKFFRKGDKIILFLKMSYTFSTVKGAKGSFVFLDDMLFLYNKQIEFLKTLPPSDFSKSVDLQDLPTYPQDEQDDTGDTKEQMEGFDWSSLFPNVEIVRKIKEVIKQNGFLQEDPYQDFVLKEIKKSLDRNEVDEDIRLLWGPPGTGKTTIIAKLIEYALLNDKTVLICSFTHVAIDNALQRALQNLSDKKGIEQFARYGAADKIRIPIVRTISIGTDFQKLTNKRIIGVTLDALLMEGWKDFPNDTFDMVIVDEASMGGFPKLGNALSKAKIKILAGDFLQLSPFDSVPKGMVEDISAVKEFRKLSSFSYFKHQIYERLNRIKTEGSVEDIEKYKFYPLFINRRSPEELIRFSNEKFYQGLLEFQTIPRESIHKNNVVPSELSKEVFLHSSMMPVYINTVGIRNGDPSGGAGLSDTTRRSIRLIPQLRQKFDTRGYIHLGELSLVLLFINQYISICKTGSPETDIRLFTEIGIITYYRRQYLILKSWIWSHADTLFHLVNFDFSERFKEKTRTKDSFLSDKLLGFLKLHLNLWLVEHLETGTVEIFQGREKNLIFVTTAYQVVKKSDFPKFFRDPYKLNVALTRPKMGLCWIGTSFYEKSKDEFEEQDRPAIVELLKLKDKTLEWMRYPEKGFLKNLDDAENQVFQLDHLYRSTKHKPAGTLGEVLIKNFPIVDSSWKEAKTDGAIECQLGDEAKEDFSVFALLIEKAQEDLVDAVLSRNFNINLSEKENFSISLSQSLFLLLQNWGDSLRENPVSYVQLGENCLNMFGDSNYVNKVTILAKYGSEIGSEGYNKSYEDLKEFIERNFSPKKN